MRHSIAAVEAVSLQSFESGILAASQAVTVGSMVRRNQEILEPNFPGITERYKNWLTATRSVRRAALSQVVDASVITLQGRTVGVASAIVDRPVGAQAIGEISEASRMINVAYWLDEASLRERSDIAHSSLHAAIGAMTLAHVLEHQPDSTLWATLPVDEVDDSSRGLRALMHPLGAAGEFSAQNNTHAIDLAPGDGQLYILQP